jgi:hypothetical protein
MNNRFYLNEEEKKRILQMHKPRLNQKIIEEQSLQDIQNIILDNGGYVGKLGADNKLGPDTLNAIYNSLTKGFAKNNTATAQGTSGVQGTSGTAGVAGTSGTAGVAGTSGTAGVAGTSGTAGVAGTSGTAGVAGTSATVIPGQPKSAQQIRQDYRQQKQNERQGARVVRKNKKELEKELKDLQTNYQRLQNKMTPEDKQSYELRMGQIQTDLSNF